MNNNEWRKSTYSGNVECVEVANGDDHVHIRDTDDPSVVLTVRPKSWRAFLAGVKAGEFDHLAEETV